jgi:Mn-dependent DtxR family transcriptional regulator
MLGVRRPGVTDALNALRKQGLISYKRGKIIVRDRKKRYGVPEAEYRRLIG